MAKIKLQNTDDIGPLLFAGGGQSNFVSHATGVDVAYLDPTDPRIRQWPGSGPYVGNAIVAVDPLYHHEQRAGTVGHFMQFARRVLPTLPPNREIWLIPGGHSSTGFSTSSLLSPPAGYTQADGGGWDTTGAQGGINLYELLIAQMTAAYNAALAKFGIPPRWGGMLWLQGEADAGALTTSQYAAKLDLLIAGIRARVPGASTIPFLIGEMLPERATAGSIYTQIWNAHLDTPKRNTRCAVYYGQFGYGLSASPSELHYGAAGQRDVLGNSAYDALALARANVMGTAPVAPRAVTVRQSGTSVVATVLRSAGRVTDYTVQYRRNGGSWSTFAHTATLDVTFTIPGFTVGDVVDVRIATVNEQGTSGNTSASLTLVHVPNSPTLGAAAHTATSLSPTWTAAVTGDPATSFVVDVGVGGVYTSSVTVSGSAVTGQIVGLQPDASYDYRVTPVNAAGSGTPVTGSAMTDSIGFLLSDVGVSARFALSVVRKLNTSYAGSCLQVRRTTPDTTTLDIGFDGTGALDVNAMLTFCGSGDGFVSKVYDQSGNAQHFTAPANGQQPKIVSAGVVITRAGKPAAVYDGVDDCLDSTTVGLYAAGAASLLAIVELDSSAVAANNFLCEGNNTSGKFGLYTLSRCVTGGLLGGQFTNDAGTGVTLSNGNIAINTSAVVQVSAVDTGTQEANWINGVQSKALTTYTARSGVLTLNGTRIGALMNHQTAPTSIWQGAIQEVVAFASALSDLQRQAGELNQKSEFAIA